MNRKIRQKNTQIIFAKSAILILFVATVFYLYMCVSLVFDGVHLKKVAAEINLANIELAVVESDLSRAHAGLTLENTSEYGFTPAKNSYFAARTNEVTTFSMIYER
jgi:hypothetical protein